MFNGKRLSGWMALAVFATVGGTMVATDPAFASTDVDKLTMGGELRVRYEVRNNDTFGGRATTAAGTNSKGDESAASHRVRVDVGYALTPDVSFFAQIQDARIWGSEGGATGNTASSSGIGAVSGQNGNGTGVDLHQAYIQLKNVLTPGLSLKLGRQELIYGDHRLLGNFGWSQIGNSFDAVKLMYSTSLVDVDLFAARIFDTEIAGGCTGLSNNCSGVVFPGATQSGTLQQNLYGLYVTLKPVANWTIEPYYLLLQDTRPVNFGNFGPATTIANAYLTTPQAPDQTRSTLGTRVAGKTAGFDVTAEGDWQFGSMASGTQNNLFPGASIQNRDIRINAWAGAAKAGYTFEPVPMKPRIGAEIDYASGDSCHHNGGNVGLTNTCSRDGHNNTFDNLFPTNHNQFGYMDLQAWKNMVNYQVSFDVKPSPVSKFEVRYIIHRLANKQDDWYRAGQVAYGVSSQGNTSSYIGSDLDLSYWHTFKEKFKFEVGVAHFWAGSYITNPANANAINGTVAGSSTSAGQNWGYVMGSVKF